MKTIYLDCSMGASGDMLMGALVGLLENAQDFLEKMNSIGLPHTIVSMEKSTKCGIVGNHIHVVIDGMEEESHDHHEHEHEHHHHHHAHSGLSDIQGIIASLNVSQQVKGRALRVYDSIAAAEAAVHGTTIEQIHFHEVGSLDAVADVVGVCLLLEMLAPDCVIASPVRTGFGHVHCAHGILPVPAPATVQLLQGVPCYAGDIQGEMLTPTGAALLREIVSEFKEMPILSIEKIGYGMGSKDFACANCVRAIFGTQKSSQLPQIVELKCNLDDMTAEAIGYAVNALLDAGALDVFTQSIQMKKNRPATMLTCLCRESNSEEIARLMLFHTTTRGVRKTLCERYELSSHTEIKHTALGDIRMKISQGYDIVKRKPEYEDIAAIAKREGLSIAQVLEKIVL